MTLRTSPTGEPSAGVREESALRMEEPSAVCAEVARPASPVPKVRAVDLFCGIGGLTHGLLSSGIAVKAGYDIDASCRHAFEANNRGATFVQADVRGLRYEDLEAHFQGADVSALVGCAPCQPFSAHTRRSRDQRKDDCSLLLEFARLVEEGTPDVVSIENVPGLARHEAFATFVATLRALGYHIDHDVLSCLRYGVPQRRRRLVLLASKLGPISLPGGDPGTRPTVSPYIKDQPRVADGQAHDQDAAHVTMPLSELNRRRIRQSKPGGTWRDWDDDLVNACHRETYYPAPYGRMRWDAPAPTITTQFCYYSTGRFGHPEQDRTISVREAALLQTFPGDYDLVDEDAPLVVHKLARHIGNAVPVKLAAAIGAAIVEAASVH